MKFFALSKAISLLMAFLMPLSMGHSLCFAQDSVSQAERSSEVYFATSDIHDAPLREAMTSFDCSDKIFTVVELENYPSKKHQLSVKWVDPYGQTREHTKYPFTSMPSPKTTRVWAWLSLSRARGASVLQFIDPSAGLNEFIGEWTVEVRVDSTKIAEKTLEVSC